MEEAASTEKKVVKVPRKPVKLKAVSPSAVGEGTRLEEPSIQIQKRVLFADKVDKVIRRSINEDDDSSLFHKKVMLLQRPGDANQAATAIEHWNHLPELQRQDPWCGPYLRYLEQGSLPLDTSLAREIMLSAEQYAEEDGILVRLPGTLHQICVPAKLQPAVLKHSHNLPAAGHFGVKKTYLRLKAEYFWPRSYTDVKDHVGACRACALTTPPNRTHRQEIGQRPVAEEPWQHVHMDVWKPGAVNDAPTYRGNRKVLALVDSNTKYVVLRAIPNESAQTITDVLANDVFPQYGPPQQLISDRGAPFVATLQAEMLVTFGVARKLVIPKHPMANGQVERFFRTLRSMLGAVLSTATEQAHRHWDDYLQHLAFAYNTSHHRSIDNTPFYLFHGHDPEIGIAQPVPAPNTGMEESSQAMWMNRMVEARALARQHVEEQEEKNRENYNRRANPKDYREGDLVYIQVRPPKNQTHKKVRPRYAGPYRIAELGDHKVIIKPMNEPRDAGREMHINDIRPCQEDIQEDEVHDIRPLHAPRGRPRGNKGQSLIPGLEDKRPGEERSYKSRKNRHHLPNNPYGNVHEMYEIIGCVSRLQ
jgi:transposase InsO family protein